MRQFVRVYRYVKIAQKLIHETDVEAGTGISLVSYLSAHAVKASVQREYKKKYKMITVPEINHINVDAIKSDYLTAEHDTLFSADKRHGVSVDTLCVTTKGRKLLDFPVGTLQIFLIEYGLVVSFITGAFVAGLLAAFGKILWQFCVWTMNLFV